jgi:hypothetical protein
VNFSIEKDKTMIEISLLIALQLKHWLVDFVLQSREEIAAKKVYMSWLSCRHSLQHAIGTFLAVWLVLGYNGIPYAVSMGILDLLVHYHVDYLKMRYGTSNIETKRYWAEFGFDQLMHQATYITILGLIIL